MAFQERDASRQFRNEAKNDLMHRAPLRSARAWTLAIITAAALSA
jgi:hypothetical protein